jgi:hypothetical protein
MGYQLNNRMDNHRRSHPMPSTSRLSLWGRLASGPSQKWSGGGIGHPRAAHAECPEQTGVEFSKGSFHAQRFSSLRFPRGLRSSVWLP